MSQPRHLPSGSVTFLFSDIESSTRLLLELGESVYGALQQTHRELVREALSAGVEVSTEGDSFFFAFTDPAVAISAAIEAQRALATHPWPDGRELRVRMGLHTGEATPVNDDYTAIAVNEAARIASTAHGRQLIVSAATMEAAGDALPDGVERRSHGRHRLKDLTAPVELIELCHPDFAAEHPPLKTLDRVTHNLPVQPSPFIGRELELIAIAEQLSETRCLTLLGPGGAGKTRLAYQAAAGLLDEVPDGIWIAELADVGPDEVAGAVRRALGLPDMAGDAAAAAVVDHLRSRRAVVVLDNCEHVIDQAASMAAALLGCPEIVVLSTSRVPLRIAGETVSQVEGLDPAAAVELFVTRATAAGADALALQRDETSLSEICRRLDHQPLAIELAAARTRSMSPSEVDARLGGALNLLSKGGRDASDRQATLRGAIAWSHDLLSEPQRVLFRRLSVFRGGWTLDAAEAICADDEELAADQLVDLVDELTDHSLVRRVETADGTSRSTMAETIAAFAAEQLAAAGEQEALRARHADHHVELMASLSDLRAGSAELHAACRRLVADHDNLMAAIDHQPDDGARITAMVRGSIYLNLSGRSADGLSRLAAALERHDGSEPRAVPALGLATNLAYSLGDLTAAEAFGERGIAAAIAAGDAASEMKTSAALAMASRQQGRTERAKQLYARAVEIAREHDEDMYVMSYSGNLAGLHDFGTEGDEARRLIEESLAIVRRLGHRDGELHFTGMLGYLAQAQGDLATAARHIEQALTIARELGAPGETLTWTNGLGRIRSAQGRTDEARDLYHQALAHAEGLGARVEQSEVLGLLANLELNARDLTLARQHYSAALELARAAGAERLAAWWWSGLAGLDDLAGELDLARTGAAEAVELAERLGMAEETAVFGSQLGSLEIRTGLVEPGVGRLRHALDRVRSGGRPGLVENILLAIARAAASTATRDDWGSALRLMGHASAEATDSDPFTERALDELQTRLDPTDFEQALAEGRNLARSDALEEAARLLDDLVDHVTARR